MTKKIVLRGLLGLGILYMLYLLYLFVLSPSTNLQPIYLIPKDAVFVLESDTPVAAWNTVSSSEAWSHLTNNSYFSELTESVQKVDTLLIPRNVYLNNLMAGLC